jgi:hypothetical protein
MTVRFGSRSGLVDVLVQQEASGAQIPQVLMPFERLTAHREILAGPDSQKTTDTQGDVIRSER